MIYRLLFRNEWRDVLRSLKVRHSLFVRAVFAVLGLYFSFTLVVLGLYFDRFSIQVHAVQNPVDLLNAYLLSGLYGLFGLRFLFQKTPALRLQPYLHLPIERRQLVRFFQALTCLNIHNVYPFLFILPFWAVHIRAAYATTPALYWLLGVSLCLFASNFLNLLLRSLLTRYESWFLFLMILLTGVLYLDQTHEAPLINGWSALFFGELLRPNPVVFAGLAALTFSLPLASGALLRRQLRTPGALLTPHRSSIRVPFLEKAGKVGQLIALEGRMMWRNRRPRHYLLISLLFSTMYLIFLLVAPPARGGFLIGAIVGLFASGSFALNYGQLMFSWESAYFDGLLARDVSLRVMAITKMTLLQASCVLLFLVSLPLFLWLRPEWIWLHLAFLFYNAGVTTVLVMVLALRNRRPVDLSRTGGFFNYEGFSVAHWLWFLPTVLPPALTLLVLRHTPGLALALLATLGVLSLSLFRVWGTYFAHQLARNKYTMAEGFRLPNDR